MVYPSWDIVVGNVHPVFGKALTTAFAKVLSADVPVL